MRFLLLTLACVPLGGGNEAVAQSKRPPVTSHVTVISVDGQTKKVIHTAPRLLEAPNWSPDGSFLLLNSQGQLWRLPLSGGEPKVVPTGSVTGINNDHGISPDGKLFAISAGHIHVLPSSGGQPRQITSKTPSYYHGWSPDGKTLAYCAKRDGNFDIYGISVAGGEEKRLTTHPGYDDGPDYSPDGRWIYFNSDRSGSWDIWRMPADGAGPGDEKAERVTRDDHEDWFPHPSPDGKWLVFLSYMKGTKGHPANQEVSLRIMPLPASRLEKADIRELVRLFGGQGTINVSSWSPDSKSLAFVSYSLNK
jgi:Tol biopolymer transport system component